MENTEKQMFSLDKLKEIIKEEIFKNLTIFVFVDADNRVEVELDYDGTVIDSDNARVY